MAQVDADGKHHLFLHEQFAHLHTENTDKTSNIVCDEDIMQNNHMFEHMLPNLSVNSHWIFPQSFFDFWSKI